MSLVFISYRRVDAPDAVARLHEKLAARLRNREVFYDHTSLEVGDVFPDVLRQKVTTAGVVLVVIGPNWAAELRKRAADPSKIDFVREEVRLALASGHTVIPVLVGGAAMPSEADFADTPELLPLRALNAQTVRPDPLFVAECDKLIAHLERTGPTELVGTILGGKYKVLRLVDVGGMGEVYEATQTDMKRTVAVKLIKAGMDTKEVLARFDAERQALAVMDHPNVCKVLDAGTAPNGRPFFVMEFVRGLPITRFCDDRKLLPKDRLELFTAVCKAVQHAHQKGIIHRDLKPANVLVEVIDGKPVPKVIDFGLAKACGRKLTDQSMAATKFGKWVGTLEYSSPEQAEGRFDIDTLTDVYSLGVLLHELLVGSPPFTREELLARSEDAAKEIIRTSEPAVPSVKLSSSKNLPAVAANRHLDPTALAKALRGDLDWIILKALDKSPQQRYATPTALADDIVRHLTDQPISAGKPSAWVRLRKFYRRNRPQVIAGVLVAAALVAGIVGTTLALLESERQRGLAVQAEKREKERADAEQRAREDEAKAKGEEQKAKEAAIAENAKAEKAYAKVSEMLGLMVTKTTGETLSKAKSVTAPQAILLKEALPYCIELAAMTGEDEGTRSRAAGAANLLGMIEHRLGDKNRAAEAYRKARDGYRQLVSERPTKSNYRAGLASSHVNLGQLLSFEDKELSAAKDEIGKGVVVFDQLTREYSDNSKYRKDQAQSHNTLAIVFDRLGNHREAATQCRVALEVYEYLVTAHPAETEFRIELAEYHCLLAYHLNKCGNPIVAETEFHASIEQVDKAVEISPSDPLCRICRFRIHRKFAIFLVRHGGIERSVSEMRVAAGLATALMKEFPDDRIYAVQLGECCHFVATMLSAIGETKDALAWHVKAIAALQPLEDQSRLGEDERVSLADSYEFRAVVFSKHQRVSEADKDWERSLELRPEERKPGVRLKRAITNWKTGRTEEAVAEAAELSKLPEWDAMGWYAFAAIYSVASEKFAEQRQNYADRSKDMLQKAVMSGFKDAAKLKEDETFTPLREREDFKKLLADLEKKFPPPEVAPAPKAAK